MQGNCPTLSGYDDEIALGVFFGTGVGADVLMRNKECSIFEYGLELGHLPLSLNGERCVCGKIGCAETFISGHNLQTISDAFNIPIQTVFSHWEEDSMLALRLKEFVDYQAMGVGNCGFNHPANASDHRWWDCLYGWIPKRSAEEKLKHPSVESYSKTAVVNCLGTAWK